MSAGFEVGDVVQVTDSISQGDPDPNASPYEEGWVHARSGSIGKIVEQGPDKGEFTVLFKVSKTAAPVKEENLERASIE